MPYFYFWGNVLFHFLYSLCLFKNQAKPEVFYVPLLLFNWNKRNMGIKVLHRTCYAAVLGQEAKSDRKEQGGLVLPHCDS